MLTPAGSTVLPPVMIRDTSPAVQAPSPERTYLAVPYDGKDEAKALGAKWDRAEKSWYVPAGVPLESFTPWLPCAGTLLYASSCITGGENSAYQTVEGKRSFRR